MNELERIVCEAARVQAAGSAFLLATVVRVAGSSYRRPGARMLVAGDRWVSGCVSGGCLEGDVLLRGAHRCRAGAVVVTYDSTTEDGEAWGVGLGCNGIVDVLLECVEAGAPHEALAFAHACFEAETAGALVTVIRSAHGAAPVGARLAIGPRSELVRPVADPAIRRALEQVARGAPGVVELAEHGVTALVERIAPSPQLFVLGSGHDAAPIVTLAQSIGMRVTVADRAICEGSRFLAADRVISTAGDWDRLGALIDAAAEPYVVIMHHQREPDRQALAVALASQARYVGVLGPARRTRELLSDLGHRPGADTRVHAPIGLDVGAETPEQIALAIVAELLSVQRRRSGGILRDRARSLHAGLATAVLAAGGSRRLGRPKQLVEVDGSPLVRGVVATCTAAEAGPVGVVLGANAAPVAAALGGLPVKLITNDEWRDGIASSIRAAVRWAETTGAEALAIVLGDQPLLSVPHLTALRDAWLAGSDLVASRFLGVLGAPAMFDRSRWSELARLDGDQGAGGLLRTEDVVAVDWADGAVDVDTEEDVVGLATRPRTDIGPASRARSKLCSHSGR
jgi:xanthine/CO dehydrogenase XdhC/CoxF family maturation factor